MADYAVASYNIRGTMVEVLAGLEAKLETLDSTTNVIRLINIIPEGTVVRGFIIYDSA